MALSEEWRGTFKCYFSARIVASETAVATSWVSKQRESFISNNIKDVHNSMEVDIQHVLGDAGKAVDSLAKFGVERDDMFARSYLIF